MRTVNEQYKKRKQKFDTLLQKQAKAVNHISNLRLLTFIAGAGAMIFFFSIQYYYLFAAVSAVTIAAFAYLMVRHSHLFRNQQRTSILVNINEQSIQRQSRAWIDFPDTGEEFVDPEHRYSYDLDIFGKGSLFQWTNTANTYIGRQKMKEALSEGYQSKGVILKRQEAVRELAGRLAWRQRFTVEGLGTSAKMKDPEGLITWAKERNQFYQKRWVVYGLRILPISTILLIAFEIFGEGAPFYIPLALLVLQFILLYINRRRSAYIFATAEKYKKDIKVYDGMLKLFENAKFRSRYLQELKGDMKNKEKRTAYQQVNQLAKVVDSLANRYNAFFFLFNLVTLWDYHCIFALERWKGKSGVFLEKWLYTLGEAEVLSSFAVICHDHPDWVMPELVKGERIYTAEALGHPLLGEQRVSNDLTIGKPSNVLLITGSNMSGKSTFLRTSGINLVLAYAGAPVCAKEFCCSQMEIYTCMRVSDNLEKSISSFYAELLRIKTIVKAAEEGREIFFLLDEIFKGTNSKDRHLGAKVLINKLQQLGVLGLVSTHDLELGDLESESQGRIKNFHFKEYYKGDKIHFDYKLLKGVSTTRNAVFLMRLAGIDVNRTI